MNRFAEARDRGGRYLLRQIHEDGSFGDADQGVVEYYKVPAALMVCGVSGAASRLLSWIRRHGFSENGDFGPRPKEEQDSYYYTYHNAWVIKAAHRLGQFDLSKRGMDFLLDFRDEESGGFGGLLIQATEWGTREQVFRSYELLARYVMPQFQGTMESLSGSYDWAVERRDELTTLRKASLEKARQALAGKSA